MMLRIPSMSLDSQAVALMRRALSPHMIVTDGAFRPDGTFVAWPAHDTAALTEAFRRAVLRLFVCRGLFEREDAEAMLAWPHLGFHVHDAVLVPDGYVAFALRLARYPVALELGQCYRLVSHTTSKIGNSFAMHES
jgi:hypothetical protein